MELYFVEIAEVVIKIPKINEVSKRIINDLNAKKGNDTDRYDICINVSNDLTKYRPLIYSAKDSMNFNEKEYFVDYLSSINYVVSNLFNNNQINIVVNLKNQNLKTIINSFFQSKNIIQSNTILSYSLLWYVLQLKLLQKGKAFLHAGIFSSNNKASVITGTGGCGKTSTLFKILEDKSTKYISEDFGIIDSESYSYYNPKPVSIYASDMEFGQKILQDYFNVFSITDKILWSVKRKVLKRNPMIKVNASLLMNSRICTKAKIENVIYFVRNSDSKITIRDISLDEIVERILDASMRELKTLNELIMLIRANAPVEFDIPSVDNIRGETKKVYLKAFSSTDNKILYIPYKTKPDEILIYL